MAHTGLLIEVKISPTNYELHVSMINGSNLKHYYPPEDVRQRLAIPDDIAVLLANADPPGNNNENNQRQHPPAAQQETRNKQDKNQTPLLPPPQPTKKWNFEKVLRGKMTNGVRHFRVMWLDGTTT